MASPWRFLARLVSSRREQKQTDDAIDVIPYVAAVAGQADTPPIEESAESVDQLTPENLPPVVRSEPFSAGPEPLTQSGGDRQSTAENNGIESAEDFAPAYTASVPRPHMPFQWLHRLLKQRRARAGGVLRRRLRSRLFRIPLK